MRVLFDHGHTPYGYMVAQALPEVEFVCPAWDVIFRPVPPNVTVLPWPESRDGRYDVVVAGQYGSPVLFHPAPHRIFIQHCEWHGEFELAYASEHCDRVVVVSEHKQATMKAHGLSPKVTAIPFGFRVEDWPSCCYTGTEGRVGTTANCLDQIGQMREYVETLGAHLPLTLIGHANERVRGCEKVTPAGFAAYQEALAACSVWTYGVVGESFGMSPYEAMACGLPVVLGSYPEAWNWALSGWNCLIHRNAPTDSVGWIVTQARHLLAHPDLRAEIGQAGRATVAARYPLEAVRERWLRVLEH